MIKLLQTSTYNTITSAYAETDTLLLLVQWHIELGALIVFPRLSVFMHAIKDYCRQDVL